jgi:hypothetical protein
VLQEKPEVVAYDAEETVASPPDAIAVAVDGLMETTGEVTMKFKLPGF